MRMKRNKYFCIGLAVAFVLLFATCTYDGWQDPEGKNSGKASSVAEAKAFFEKQMMWMGETGNISKLQGFVTNFTLQWKGAVVNGQGNMVSVDVPIIADIQFKAVMQI